MIEVRQTGAFASWLAGLRDRRARALIVVRIERMGAGNFGDHRPAGEGVGEMRIDHGPGYRVYCVQRGEIVVILLCGGDKSTQPADIVRAKRLAKEI